MSDRIALLNGLKRRTLAPFVHQVFQTLNSGKEFAPNWHIDTLCWHLEEVAAGRIKRLIVCVPPRSLKSTIASVAFPAWLLGRDPTSRIVCASYSNDLAAKLARDSRRVMSGERYQDLFPQTRIAGGRNTETEQETSQSGFRYATSVGGTLTGRGGDFIIVDDPAKPGEAMSEANRREVNEWFDGELITRLDNPAEGGIVIVMQRLHEDDLVGHLTRHEDHGWTVVNIPAVATEDAEYRTGRREQDVYHRKEGEVIDERRMTLSEINSRRQNMGSILFYAQYQQAPVPAEGNIIHREWLHRYRREYSREDFDCVIQSWDTASEAGELNDYSVCATAGVKDAKVYLLDILRRKLEFPELLRMAQQHALDRDANIVLVEKAVSGNALAQSLRSQLNCRVIAISPKGDKEARLNSVSYLFENATFRLPETAPWLADFESELLGFPSTKNDDQVDTITQLLGWLKGMDISRLKYNPDGTKPRRSRTRRSRSGNRRTTGRRSVSRATFGNSNSDCLL